MVRPYLVWTDSPLTDVLAHMLEHRLGEALVMDQDGLAGIFTSVDAMVALKQMTTAIERTPNPSQKGTPP
jgi:hypothetical protein